MNAPIRRIQRLHGFEPLRVEGTLPTTLRGTLFRAGPGLFERGGVQLAHPFEADGAITGVRFDGQGGAAGAIRLVESAIFREEEAAGRWLTGTVAPRWRRTLDMLRGRVKNTGNTAMLQWQDRLFALMEAGKPVEMDPATLATVGDTDLGVIPVAFSAHPHRHPSRPCQISFGVRFGPTTHLDLFELPDVGPARLLGSVPAPWAAMVHDFALTERHMVFVVGPSRLQLFKALAGLGDMTSLFTWEPDMGARILVIPLDDPSAMVTIETDPCWVWHVVNGFEDGDELVVDVSQYPNLDSLKAIGEPDLVIAPPQYVRHRIDPTRRTVRSEPRWDVAMEFPSVEPQATGRPHSRALVQAMPDAATTATGRHSVGWFHPDTGASHLHTFDPGWTASEPLFAPSEGGGHVLTMLTDPERAASCVAVLDSERVQDGPVAKVWFDQPIPGTFHGTYRAG